MLLQNTMKLLQKYGMNFLNGLGTTLLLALISVAIGCVIGAIVAILRLGKSKVLRRRSRRFTPRSSAIRRCCSSCISSISCCRIFMPALKLSKFTCITIALVINSGAYMSEVFRSGIQSIDRGQTGGGAFAGSLLPPDDDAHYSAPGFQKRPARPCATSSSR